MRHGRHGSLIALALVLASCEDEAATPKGPRGVDHPAKDHGFPMDDVLRMNHVQVKATHNSYHVMTAGTKEPTFKYTHLPLAEQTQTQGVRGFELDPRLLEASGRFEVFHLPFIDELTTCRFFTDCLTALKEWSDAHPAHVPLFMQLEPKDLPVREESEAYFRELEAEIVSVWPRERIIAPDDVQRDAPTLHEAVATRGWPTLAQARGTILFYLDNSAELRDWYSRGGTSLEGRLVFIDADKADDPLAAVMILNDPKDKDRIDAAARAGVIIRTRADEAGSPEERQAALATGAHVLSSDAPATFTLPDAHPIRCNPIVAPSECTTAALEKDGL